MGCTTISKPGCTTDGMCDDLKALTWKNCRITAGRWEVMWNVDVGRNATS